MTAARTYSLLGAHATPPSAYEIVTSRLTTHATRGFEVDVPLGAWYARHQAGSPLRCADWDGFADPRETTYASYTRLQQRQERELDAAIAAVAHDDAAADDRLSRTLSAVRFPLHGLSMVAAYVGQMAPSSRLTLAALFQAADELRRIDRLAYRLAALGLPDADARGRTAWQAGPDWQPLRALIEHLLVAYDWGEAVVGLNLCVKPVIDELVCLQWPRAGAAADRWSTTVLTALAADCAWHRAWMRALVHHVLDDAVGARDAGAVIAGWLARWTPRALAAARAVAPQLGLDGVAAAAACAVAHAGVVAEAGLATGGNAR